MKRALLLSFIVALTTSAHAEIVRRNIGVKQILPGNQTTVSGNGTGVVTVAFDGTVDGAVAVDTTTLKTRIDQVGIDTGTLQSAVAVATGGFKTDYAQYTSTSDAQQTKFQNFNSTSDTHQDAALNFLSTAGVNVQALNNFNSTSSTHQDTIANFSSTNSTLNDNQNLWISTTTTEFKDRAVPTRWSNEGANLANATAVDCVGSGVACTASGSTVTMTVGVTVSTGGNVLRLSPSESTGPISSADIFDTFGATNAINAVGAFGLLGGGSTVQASIITAPGVFKTFNTTIPVDINFGGEPGIKNS